MYETHLGENLKRWTLPWKPFPLKDLRVKGAFRLEEHSHLKNVVFIEL